MLQTIPLDAFTRFSLILVKTALITNVGRFANGVISQTVSLQTCWVDSQTSDSQFADLIYYAYSVLFLKLSVKACV